MENTKADEIIRLDDSDSDDDAPRHKQLRPNTLDESIALDDDEQQPSTSSQAIRSSQQSSVNENADKSPLEAFTMFVLEDLQSVSVVGDPGFVKLVNFLRPDLELPTSDDIINQILLLYGIERSNLLDTLAGVPTMSLAIERWTSFSANTYATIKANFINDDWEPESYVLSTVQLNDGNDIEILNNRIADVSSHWEIDTKIVSVVYDWCPLPTSSDTSSFTTITCFAEKLQKCIDRNFESNHEVWDLLDKCKRLVTFFLHNNNAEIYLHKYQQYLEISCDQLIQASDDEINSTYLMLDRLLEQKQAIYSVLADTDAVDGADVAELKLTDRDWLIVRELVNTLKPFQMVKFVLHRAKDHVASVAVVKPMIHSFCTNFLNASDETMAVRELKRCLRSDLWSEFHMYNSEGDDNQMNAPDYFDIATFLDPRYKKQEYLTEAQHSVVDKYLRDVYFPKSEAVAAKSTAVRSSSTRALQFLFPSKQTAKIHECDRYAREPELDKSLSPHKWWKLNERNYPTLSLIAKKHLCTYSTSKPIFTGRNAMLRRKNLPPHVIDKAIFLNHKLKFDI